MLLSTAFDSFLGNVNNTFFVNRMYRSRLSMHAYYYYCMGKFVSVCVYVQELLKTPAMCVERMIIGIIKLRLFCVIPLISTKMNI